MSNAVNGAGRRRGPRRKRSLAGPRSIALFVLAGLLTGCSDPSRAPTPDGGDTADAWVAVPTDEVDVLFVLNNSPNSSDALVGVWTNVPGFVGRMFSGDFDGDGAPDAVTARSVHIGVTTTDLGPPRVPGDTYCVTETGDDGRLVTSDSLDCLSSPNIVAFQPSADRADVVIADIVCNATVRYGCAYQQPLDAALKALSPAPGPDGLSPVAWTADRWVPPLFRGGTFGHGGPEGASHGFVREESVLVIILLSGEDDCSSPERALYDDRDPTFSARGGPRCLAYGDALFSIERYIDGLGGLRRRPERIVFAGIVGIPPSRDGSVDYDGILADPDMATQFDELGAALPVPVCHSPSFVWALPARRIVETARGLDALGAQVVLYSVCDGSYLRAFDAVAAAVGAALAGGP